MIEAAVLRDGPDGKSPRMRRSKGGGRSGLTWPLCAATSGAMLRMRAIGLCLLAVVLVTAQMVNGSQAAAMAAEAPQMAAGAHAVMAADEMSEDCGACGEGDAAAALCPASCCASCTSAGAVLPPQTMQGTAFDAARGQGAARLLSSTGPSPQPTPPRFPVLS